MDLKKILIIKPSSLGDVVQALPIAKILKKRFHGVSLAWMVNEELSGLVENNPYLDEIFLFKRNRWKKQLHLPFNILEFIKLVKAIRKRRFDLVIDLQGLFRSGMIAFLSGSPRRSGFRNARELSPLFYTKKIDLPDGKIHSVERYLYAAKVLGIEDKERDFSIFVSGEDRDYVEDFLKKEKIYDTARLLIINPWARWKTKVWPMKNYILLIKKLKEKRYSPILIGSEEARKGTEDLLRCFSDPPAVFVGQSLKRMTALIEKASLMITNDSGPMHVAAAVRTPVIALFGPTDPHLTGPYGKGHIVIQKKLDCVPCMERKCSLLHECLTGISVEEVFGCAEKKLEEIKTGEKDSSGVEIPE